VQVNGAGHCLGATAPGMPQLYTGKQCKGNDDNGRVGMRCKDGNHDSRGMASPARVPVTFAGDLHQPADGAGRMAAAYGPEERHNGAAEGATRSNGGDSVLQGRKKPVVTKRDGKRCHGEAWEVVSVCAVVLATCAILKTLMAREDNRVQEEQMREAVAAQQRERANKNRHRRLVARHARQRRQRRLKQQLQEAGALDCPRVGWPPVARGNVTFFTYNVGGRFGRPGSTWRPFEDALPERGQRLLGVLTETFAESSGACGRQHRSFGSKRDGHGGGVRLVFSDEFAARRLNTDRVAREAGVEGYADLVAGIFTIGANTITKIGVYIPPGNPAAFNAAGALIRAVIAEVRSGKHGAEAAKGHVAVSGDINAHCGSGENAVFSGWMSEDVRCNARGKDLADLCDGCGLVPVNSWDGTAEATFVRSATRGVLDYILMDQALADKLVNVRVVGETPGYHSLDPIIAGGDGHRWLEARVQLQTAPQQWRKETGDRPLPPACWATLTRAAQRKYSRVLNARCRSLLEEGGAGCTVAALEKVTEEVAQEVFGDGQVWPNGGADPRESSKAPLRKELYKIVRKYKRRMQRCRALGDAEAAQAAYLRARSAQREIRRVARKSRNADIKRHRIELRWDASHGRGRLAWERRKRINGTLQGRTPIPPLLRADGRHTTSDVEQQELLGAHFAATAVAPPEDDPRYDTAHAKRVHKRFRQIMRELKKHKSFGRLDRALTAKELVQALRQLPRHKAADASGFRAEHMLHMLAGVREAEAEHLPAVKAWLKAFNKVWRSFGREVPENWLRQIIIPLYKGHGRPPNVAQSYRGISVTHHVEAVLHRIVIDRLAKFADERNVPTDSQFGFRAAMNTEQAIAQLRWLLEARVMQGRTAQKRRTFCAFLDVRSAFDSVWREGLIVKLFEHGIRGRTLAYLKHGPLMSSTRTVRVGNAPLDEEHAWSDTRGVAQGVIGSPFAYSIMAADLIKAVRLNKRGCGVRLNDGSRVHSISYADDIVLMAESAEGLQRMLDAAFRHSRRDRFNFEPDKCEIVVFTTARDAGAPEESKFYLDGQELRKSDEFKYLGVPVHRLVKVGGKVLTISEARRRNLVDKIKGEGRRLNLLRVSAADPVMTPLDTRMIYFGNIEGFHHYAAASEVRGLSKLADAIQIDSARIMVRLPDRTKGFMPNDVLLGELGLQDASATAVKATLRLFSRVHVVPQHHQLPRVYRHYRQAVAAAGYPRGNWVTWLRTCLQYAGHPEYEDRGWPRGESVCSPAAEVAKWQHEEWRERVENNGCIGQHYSSICKHRELAEYMREGSAESRRAILRFRCGVIAAEVTWGRQAKPQVPHDLRHCPHCDLDECEDVEHVLLRCPSFDEERAQMMAAARENLDSSVIEWAGNPEQHPVRWLAVLLDGEMTGAEGVVPNVKCYGRSLKAIRGFKGFWRHGKAAWRRACYDVVKARQALRKALRKPLVKIARELERRSGLTGWC